MLDPSILVGSNSAVPPTLAGSADLASSDTRAAEVEQKARVLAAAIEMLASIDAAGNLVDAAERSTLSICKLVSARRAVILWRSQSVPSNTPGLKVIADSESRSGERHLDEQRFLVAAGEEVATRGELTQWPAREAGDTYALMAVAQFAGACSASSLTGVTLSNVTGRDCGVLLVIDPGHGDADFGGQPDRVTSTLLAFAEPLSSKLLGIERLQPGRIETLTRSLLDLTRGARGRLIATLVAVATLVMLVPMSYQMRAELVLQPIEHRFVAVPFDGPLESAHVRPGDLVEQGDLLASINPREIEYELASVRAELSRSLQEKKGLMAEHDVAGSKIAALESDRLRLQSDLLQYRRDHLEIRSPIAGVVVSGDWKQSEGMPMSRGETLFEIAPLGQMVVEIAVPEEDVAHVRTGMHVDFYVHALPRRTITGAISRLHPRAELRDHDNVYIAEVNIGDPDNVLRPGMRGRAKIHGDRHPLGWNLFHKAYYSMRRALGW